MQRLNALAILAALLVYACLPPARAESPADFYKGKQIDLYIGYTSGGGYDIYARLLARHMGKHIPGNPIIVPKNMDGAGSLRLANWLYRVAPKDGTVFGTIGRGIPFDPIMGGKGAQFTATDFGWIGSCCHPRKDAPNPRRHLRESGDPGFECIAHKARNLKI